MAGIGHNKGPTMEAGTTWRKTAWAKARTDLLPNLPIEVVRLRVARARALGLPYKTYASVRAASGHDVIGFLFSSNALRVLNAQSPMRPEVAAQITRIAGADRVALLQGGVREGQLCPPCDAGFAAPSPWATFAQQREALAQVLGLRGLNRRGTVIVGDTDLEQAWCVAARAAAVVPPEAVFGTP